MNTRVLDKDTLLSIVIPVFNEEEVLESLFHRLDYVVNMIPLTCEIILVNDGSRDSSQDKMCKKASIDPHYRIIELSRNFGHQSAVSAGLSLAKGNAIAVIDADLQDPPELLLPMLERWVEGIDVVYGKRTTRDGETRLKRFTAYIFYRLLSWMASSEIPKDTGDFRLMDKKVVTALNSMPEHHRFLRGMIAWLGFRQEAYMYDRAQRAAGITKYPLRKMIRLSLDAMFSFSMKPLRWMALIGLTMTLLGFVAVCILIVLRYLYPEQFFPGTAGILAAIVALFGVNYLCLGILGEYLGRTYVNTQARPNYIIKDVYSKGFHQD
jgi:polyisoprenyl-phosphate glycosyltransferase